MVLLNLLDKLFISELQLLDSFLQELDVCSIRVLLELYNLHHIVERVIDCDLQTGHISPLPCVEKSRELLVTHNAGLPLEVAVGF